MRLGELTVRIDRWWVADIGEVLEAEEGECNVQGNRKRAMILQDVIAAHLVRINMHLLEIQWLTSEGWAVGLHKSSFYNVVPDVLFCCWTVGDFD